MITVDVKTIAEQLTDIYFNQEWWHDSWMSHDEALAYHQNGIANGTIIVYTKDEEVLGYYERFIEGDTAELRNVWVKESARRGLVFKLLYTHFLKTLPESVVYIKGEKQRVGGKRHIVKINKERIYGKH
jgi:hypothetical protein